MVFVLYLFVVLFNAVQDCIKGQWVSLTHCEKNIEYNYSIVVLLNGIIEMSNVDH